MGVYAYEKEKKYEAQGQAQKVVLTSLPICPKKAGFFLILLLFVPFASAEYCTQDEWSEFYEGSPVALDCTWTGVYFNSSEGWLHAWNNGSIEPEWYLDTSSKLTQMANSPDRFDWVTHRFGFYQNGSGVLFGELTDSLIGSPSYYYGSDNATYWEAGVGGSFSIGSRVLNLSTHYEQGVNDDYMSRTTTLCLESGPSITGRSLWGFWGFEDIELSEPGNIDQAKITLQNGTELNSWLNRTSDYISPPAVRLDITDIPTAGSWSLLKNNGRVVYKPVSGANGRIAMAEKLLNASETFSSGDCLSETTKAIDIEICLQTWFNPFGSCSFDHISISTGGVENATLDIGNVYRYDAQVHYTTAGGNACIATLSAGCYLYLEDNTSGSYAYTESYDESIDCQEQNRSGCIWVPNTGARFNPHVQTKKNGTYYMRVWYNEDPTEFKYFKIYIKDNESPVITIISPENASDQSGNVTFNATFTDDDLWYINLTTNKTSTLTLEDEYRPKKGNMFAPNSDFELDDGFGCNLDRENRPICSGGQCYYDNTTSHTGNMSVRINDSVATQCCIRVYNGVNNYRACTTASDWTFLNITQEQLGYTWYYYLENYGGGFNRVYKYGRHGYSCGGGVAAQLGETYNYSVWAKMSGTQCWFDDFMVKRADDDTPHNDYRDEYIFDLNSECSSSAECTDVRLATWNYGVSNASSSSDNKLGPYCFGNSPGDCLMRGYTGESFNASLSFDVPDGAYLVYAYGYNAGGQFYISWDNNTWQTDPWASSISYLELTNYVNVSGNEGATIYIRKNTTASVFYIDRIGFVPLVVRNYTAQVLVENADNITDFEWWACDRTGNCASNSYLLNVASGIPLPILLEILGRDECSWWDLMCLFK